MGHFVCKVDTIEEALIYGTFVGDNGVLLILSIIYSVSNHESLAIGWEEFVNEGFDHWLGNVLLYEDTLVHPKRVVEHRPSARLFGLIGEHGNALRLRVVQERRKQGHNAQNGLRNHNVRKLVLSRNLTVVLRLN